MLLLTSSDKVVMITSTASAIDVHASFMDASTADPPVVKGSTSGNLHTAISSAVASPGTDIVVAPAASTLRTVKQIYARNKDASASNDLTVGISHSGTVYELFKVTLLAGQTLELLDKDGFFIPTTVSRLDTKVMVTGDSVHATAATWANITGLQATVTAGLKYGIECYLQHQTNATTTGAQFGIGGVAMTEMSITGHTVETLSASVTAQALSLTVAPVTAVDTAILVETTGPGANKVFALMLGYFIPSASGTFSVRATSEVTVASGLTVVKGSWARIFQFDN